jgi:uncharacterized protein
MDIIQFLSSSLITIIGLVLFEVVSSVDNAVINAEILHGMSAKARRWFLTWGLIFAVFAVRGLLPIVIVWVTNPSLGFGEVLTGVFTSDPRVIDSIHHSAPYLLMGGGVFLVFLFFNWLFLESKNVGLSVERFFAKNGIWFYSVVSILLVGIVYKSLSVDPLLTLAAVIGSTAFFITHGFSQQAELAEKNMLAGDNKASEWSKILFLLVIDSIFSIDGVVGAFAFTLSVPLILIGNGIGALVVRQLTVHNIDRIKSLAYLKNGAMYSLSILGTVMIADAFGIHVPEWIAPLSTFLIVGWFFLRSTQAAKKGEVVQSV